ncbi:MAG: glycine--tRNA ligase subunit beta [Gammaproteobacteria bacterium]|nr:glycine--tRNA ligase subunit beta [Gammaproteobacteria bacterium]
MADVRDFLVELGTEELPPKALEKLSDAFADGIVEGLKKAELKHGEVITYAAPRRLAVMIKGLQSKQADKVSERRGPAVQSAYKEDGCPTPATEGFARSCGTTVEALEVLKTDKGEWLVFKQSVQGQATAALLPAMVEESLHKLPIPKRMRWGSVDHQFVRPAHWLVMLLGKDVIECEILGCKAGRETLGHRFHHPAALTVAEPAAYETLLETEGHVLASFERRQAAIKAQVEEVALKAGGTAVIDPALLDEVTGLVEWPHALMGNFEQAFLQIPAEALVSAMKGHQKYFHLLDKSGKLLPHFITVANIDSKNITSVQKGNERVIRPRLSDAGFFWNQDRKKPLAARREQLKSVVFQKDLGTVFEKTERIAALSGFIAGQAGGNKAEAIRAGELAKCDLMSEMVGEFPELQGIMGQYYARHDGEAEAVAAAMNEQYMPRFAGDELPRGVAGQAVAIADKIDTLVGIFGIGQPPTGSKDPFALRRAAIGVLRIIIERGLSQLDLQALVNEGVARYKAAGKSFDAGLGKQVFDFMLERLRVYYSDINIGGDVYEAVLATQPTRPYDFDQRVRAVNAFRQLPQAEALAAANKRASNILRQAAEKGITVPASVDTALLQDAAEQALFKGIVNVSEAVKPAMAAFDYTSALQQMAVLREPVDAFFDQVMVMADDSKVRDNRLALLGKLTSLFTGCADIARLQ